MLRREKVLGDDSNLLLYQQRQTLIVNDLADAGVMSGETSTDVFYIELGFVVLSRVDVDGRLFIVDLLGKGDYFGPGLANGNASHQAVAKPGARVRRLGRQEFAELLSAEADENQRLIQQLACREQRLYQRLFRLSTASLEQRLAATLLELFSIKGETCGHGHQVDVRLTQQELACLVGGSRQSVSQLLADWKRRDIVFYTREYICLEDRPALRELVEKTE